MNEFAINAINAKAADRAAALSGMSSTEKSTAIEVARAWDSLPATLRANSAPWALKDEAGKWDFSWNGVGEWPEWAAGEARLLKCLA